MKTYLQNGMIAAAALAVGTTAQAATVVQTFTETFPLTASPTGALPQINTTWNVAQYGGFGGLTSLTGVQYDVTTQLFYRGVLVGVGPSTSFNLLVRSDFNFNLPTTTPDVTTLDPQIALIPTSAGAFTPFNVPGPASQIASSTPNSATQLASDLITYVGGGVVPVTVSGSLLTTSPGVGFHNNSGLGPETPFVFVDNAKVFPMFGLQEFSLVATMTVTYTVPEPATYGAAGFLALLATRQWMARRKAKTN